MHRVDAVLSVGPPIFVISEEKKYVHNVAFLTNNKFSERNWCGCMAYNLVSLEAVLPRVVVTACVKNVSFFADSRAKRESLVRTVQCRQNGSLALEFKRSVGTPSEYLFSHFTNVLNLRSE